MVLSPLKPSMVIPVMMTSHSYRHHWGLYKGIN